jgi:hypothetical protein
VLGSIIPDSKTKVKPITKLYQVLINRYISVITQKNTPPSEKHLTKLVKHSPSERGFCACTFLIWGWDWLQKHQIEKID